MKNPFPLLAALLSIWLASCNSDSIDEDGQATTPIEVVPELHENRVGEVPSSLLSSAAKSKVNWQPWSPEVLDHARKSQRMILALIGSSRYPGCFKTLEALDRSTGLCNRLNQQFVPVLADLDLTRETGLLAYNLSSSSGSSVSFPFLLILSPDGHPVSWHPVFYTSDREIYDFFDNTVEIVSRMWEDRDYVCRDSKEKAEARIASLPEPDEALTEPGERQRRYQSAIRKIVSNYDPDISTMANAGGLFPLGILDLLTLAAGDPTLSEAQRDKALRVLESYVSVLLRSAMVDILDGGIQPARKGGSWNMVTGQRDCITQARAARVLSRMHRVHGTPGALDAAVRAVRFAETHYRTPGGMFSFTTKPVDSSDKAWLWKIDQVSSILTEDEFAVWKVLSNLKAIGNLPSEADPQRNFFRLNALYASATPEEVAAATGFEPGMTRSLIESGRKKLLKAREDRLPPPPTDPLPSALASFRMVSAYAALYTASGETEWLEKGISLGKSCRKHFLSSRFLNERPDAETEGMSDGRSFTYAIAVQAGLDLGAVTLEDEWYSWAQDLTTLQAEHFVSDDGRLLEVRQVSTVVDIAIENRMMVFDDSTAGQIRLNLKRLRALGFQTPPALKPWLDSMPRFEDFPIIYTDSIIAMSHEWGHSSIKVGTGGPQGLDDEVRKLPLQIFTRRRDDGDGVRSVSPEGDEEPLNNLNDLKRLTDAL